MYVLTDILSVTDLRSQLWFRAQLARPFAVDVPEDHKRIRFHLVGSGRAWVQLPSGESTFFETGDLVIIPHGSSHQLASERNVDSIPLNDVIDGAKTDRIGHLKCGPGDEAVELICGHFGFDESMLHPIIATLPPLIHVKQPAGEGFSWITSLLTNLLNDPADELALHDPILFRLSEIVFILVLRTCLEQRSESAIALTALADPHLGLALEAIHEHPETDWSLERLAEVAGLSRSLFAERFKRELTITPMRYVTEWRMQKARQLLREKTLTVSRVRRAIGYSSDAAFSRTYKEHFDITPGAQRKLLS